jgi:hypothetical protein
LCLEGWAICENNFISSSFHADSPSISCLVSNQNLRYSPSCFTLAFTLNVFHTQFNTHNINDQVVKILTWLHLLLQQLKNINRSWLRKINTILIGTFHSQQMCVHCPMLDSGTALKPEWGKVSMTVLHYSFCISATCQGTHCHSIGMYVCIYLLL